MALQELPFPVVHLAQGSSREEKRSVALALLLVFTLGINRTPIHSKLLVFVMWEPPAPQSEAECMARGIREGNA